MTRSVSSRVVALVLGIVVLGAGCGALEDPENGWTVDEEAVAERRAADEVTAARERLAGVARQVGTLSVDDADCVVAGLLDERPDDAALDLVDPDVDSSRLQTPLATALVECDAVEAVAAEWIPELAVTLAGETGPQQCVRDTAEPWAADRFAEVVLAGGFAADEVAVDRTWLAGVVDGCDAGAAMMAADATLAPRVGADARTPSRWLCAAAAAPVGAFDDFLDPAVVDDEARLEALESRITGYFTGCT